MNLKSIGLIAGLACFCWNSANAVPVLVTPPKPSDFSLIETPGQYTVINNSTDWYIYGFAVSNPFGSNPTTTQGAPSDTRFCGRWDRELQRWSRGSSISL